MLDRAYVTAIHAWPTAAASQYTGAASQDAPLKITTPEKGCYLD